MKRIVMKSGPWSLALVVVGVAVLACGAPASGQVDCAHLPQWTNFPHPPQVNQEHIFCGEWSGVRPKGFHSRPGGLNPATVGAFAITQAANGQGIYGGTWSYAGHPGVTKFSTMYPDACSVAEVLKSIVYAAQNHIVCPPGAPAWAWCGYNRPNGGAATYCDSTDHTRYVIAGADDADGDVNTAFPLR